ncbi:TRIM3 [Branchiostoma lanceolatum]|uniref:TRIM3 protein n=1 Tax=Branchiostoma lanceolatum TaxID=7740 RepID=A0A8K0EZQ2_BRALA|nr:TRIM3 [Branchiostoma lanceolatum]
MAFKREPSCLESEEIEMTSIQGDFDRHGPEVSPLPPEKPWEVLSCRPKQPMGQPTQRPSGQTPGQRSRGSRKRGGRRTRSVPSRPAEQTLGLPSSPSEQRIGTEDRSRPSGQSSGDSSRGSVQIPVKPPHPPGQTPVGACVRPNERDGKVAGVYRHRLREEDIVKMPLNPMYGADLDLPSGPDGQETTPKEVGGATQAEMTVHSPPGVSPGGPATHAYEDGDTFGMRLGPPLKREARAPPTPRPERPPAEHVYEDGMSFGMRLGPAVNRDDLNAPPVPSTPRPGRQAGGAQQVPAGPNPLSNPQAILNQLRPNPMYNSNQPQPPAPENRTIWGQLRHRLSQPRLLICVAVSSVALVTLLISVPVLLTHLNSGPGNHDSSATTTAGPNITGRAAWKSSAVLMRTAEVTSADVIKPAATRTGRTTTDRIAHARPDVLMKTDEVTSADVIKVNPVHGHGPSHGITAEMEAAGPTPINMPVSTITDIKDQGSRCGDESGAGNLHRALGVAVSADQKIWVADLSKALLQVYNMEGVYLCQFPPSAQGLGYPSKTPYDVSIDKDGHLWVLMNGYPASPESVVQVSRDGHLKATFDLPDTVPRGVHRGMAVGLRNNHIFVTWSGSYSGGVQAFDAKGKLLWEVGQQQRMARPMNVAVNGKGNIFVSDFRAHSIYEYDEAGQYVSEFGGPGLSGGRLNHPRGICVDTSGHTMVVDSENQRVVMFTNQGAYLRHITVRAKSPTGVAVGPGGQLVVINKRSLRSLSARCGPLIPPSALSRRSPRSHSALTALTALAPRSRGAHFLIAILGALTAKVLSMFKTIAEVTALMALSPRCRRSRRAVGALNGALAALSALSRRSGQNEVAVRAR